MLLCGCICNDNLARDVCQYLTITCIYPLQGCGKYQSTQDHRMKGKYCPAASGTGICFSQEQESLTATSL